MAVKTKKSKNVIKKIAKVTKSAKKKVAKSIQAKSPKSPQKATKGNQTKIQTVPNLTLAATGGQQVNLKDLVGRKVVLYFYPKDMTPGCTIEGHEFTKLKAEFEKRNAVVYGVSRDTVALHEKFKAKECYTIDLLSDSDEKLCKSFDVIKDKNMYGKTVRGIERSTFIIDETGKVAHAWRGVKAEGHASEVLEYLKNN